MNKKILIDGAFKEETRIALLDNGILQDYDREDFNFKQLKGNIYLAKITKIEPSLQAAFVDYNGDKHGFLPFSDIHPDYYNIDTSKNISSIKFFYDTDTVEEEKNDEDEDLFPLNVTCEDNENDIQQIHNYSVDEEIDEISKNDWTKYRIENVIKEGQYVLVQVLKEERGNKGVALTTYISLAGKYCVLMPNNPKRSGISKKITNINDRKILKSILRSLKVSPNKSLVLRTASVGRKPEDILKDYLYLSRLWEAIKNTTIESNSPTFIHAEDDILKKTIRDIYTEDVNEIIVEGESTYKNVLNLSKIVLGNQNVNIKLYEEKIPLFYKYNIEDQLIKLYDNKVILPSGGSIVIDQTEALVAIDVNSAKATKEKSIEEMAVATNIEAAREIARQVKLRDLAGLIVIDYIDMFELKNRRLVEKEMKDAMLTDRAKIQIARLSIFGLMEVSRQRLNASYAEKTSEICPRCSGKGKIKSREIVALSILRAVKYIINDKTVNTITLETTHELFSYLVNYKRKEIEQIEKNYNIHIFLEENSSFEGNEYNIKKRTNLTEKEKEKLYPYEKTGKVNLKVEDSKLYSINEDEIEKYKFEKNTYPNTSKKFIKKSYNKSHNTYYNETPKKENWLKKILGI